MLQVSFLEQLPLGLLVKAFTGIKVLYDCREDNAAAMFGHRNELSTHQRWFVYYATRLVEYLAARFFDGMIVSDPAIYRIHYAAPAHRKTILYNVPSLGQFPRTYEPLADRPYDLVVMGSMTPRSGVLPFIEAVGLLKQRGCRATALLLGQPDEWVMPTLRNRIHQLDLEDQVSITGFVPYEDVPRRLAEAKIGMVPLLDLPKFRNNIACKAFEYMACGMPVISSDLPPERVFLREGQTALFVEPGNVQAMAEAIHSLLSDPSRAQAMGEAGRQDMERHWNVEQSEAGLQGFYAKILGTDRGGLQEPGSGNAT
jgi:glycosyltransferase involved in cell wall biosynthesis